MCMIMCWNDWIESVLKGGICVGYFCCCTVCSSYGYAYVYLSPMIQVLVGR